MKLSYVTTYDATDVHNWSGTGYYMANALKNQGADLDYIGNLRTRAGVHLRMKKYFYHAFGKTFPLDREPRVAGRYADQVSQRIKADTDVIFSPGSLPIAFLNTKIPKVFYTDATFAGMLGFYEGFSRLSRESVRHGMEVEQAALSSSALAIYSSEWAANSALANYDVDERKVKVVPFGANSDDNRSMEDIREMVSSRRGTKCKLLFVAVEWHRKGGDLALAVAEKLNEMGQETELHIAGLDKIPMSSLPPFVINHGFISKAEVMSKKKLDHLFAESHFMLVPSRAEAFGMIFGEASSFGLPSLTRDVGGLATVIKNGKNGQLFHVSATADEYATYIRDCLADEEKYNELAISSFVEYQNRLNWAVSGREVMHLINEIR